MATITRGAFKDWTMEDLILANGLRDQPVSGPDLPLYNGHKYSSLRVVMTRLRRSGQLDRYGKTVPDHPLNLERKGAGRFFPLPDLALPPPGPSARIGLHTLSHAATAPDADHLTKERAATILGTAILSGHAGKDMPRFIEAWSELQPRISTAGPPPPETAFALVARLLSIFSTLDPPIIRRAYRRWEKQLAHASQPGEALALPGPDDADLLGAPEGLLRPDHDGQRDEHDHAPEPSEVG
jgi:hypothetical protein